MEHDTARGQPIKHKHVCVCVGHAHFFLNLCLPLVHGLRTSADDLLGSGWGEEPKPTPPARPQSQSPPSSQPLYTASPPQVPYKRIDLFCGLL